MSKQKLKITKIFTRNVSQTTNLLQKTDKIKIELILR